ncbi:MAG TPA: hypothetical protein VIK53_12850 [Verrucomicrobiae bacterium]
MIAFINENSGGKPSIEDFHKKRTEIFDFICEKKKPASVSEIAKHISRDEKTTESYCNLISEMYGTIKLFAGEKWGLNLPRA